MKNDDTIVEVQQVGTRREPMDFLYRAIACGHPRTMAIHLPDAVQEVLKENINGNLFELAKKRTPWLWKWAKRAGELEKEEHLLKQSRPEHLRTLLGRKRLLLMKEMLEECDYPDKQIVNDITTGFNLTGWSTSSGVFPKQVKRPQYDVQHLRLWPKVLTNLFVHNCNPWTIQMRSINEELDKGYIWLDDSPDASSCVLAKRFGLVQKEKYECLTIALLVG